MHIPGTKGKRALGMVNRWKGGSSPFVDLTSARAPWSEVSGPPGFFVGKTLAAPKGGGAPRCFGPKTLGAPKKRGQHDNDERTTAGSGKIWVLAFVSCASIIFSQQYPKCLKS